ncbi:MAG: carboxypeptidase regulatory-like domain-containing protein [Acidobacteria bacterium]|nr:carboxypeptidase regulatory-like domain-containing protein [Acidobacteriota bacterium]MBK9529700.1 carboxypeptidase regulatory-like domain-containing protein [Acidobacteriota bacterium]MBP7475679.1 carboxypeptidase regulatory-like domain-containing protein [Pyrinomonadaceae bacterium]MBP9108399.1 carboxypeptidase regulatory-like domain-containing protein [Pyrinomonadaceae bacterium]
MLHKFIVLIVLACASCGAAVSQTTSDGGDLGISGEVVSYQQGAVIVAAKITVSSKGLRKETRSDSLGKYNMVLPPGVYLVEIAAPGFRKVTRKNLKIEGKGFFTFNVNMEFGKAIIVDEKHP